MSRDARESHGHGLHRASASSLAPWPRRIIFILLIVTGLIKLLLPGKVSFLGTSGSVLMGAAEVGVACALQTRWQRWALAVALAMASGGIVMSVTLPSASCGCLGRLWDLSRREHMMLAGLLGFWACLGLGASSTSRLTSTG